MTVNINKNALNPKASGDSTQLASTKPALSKLSSGISLPAATQERANQFKPTQDSNELSNKAATRQTSSQSSLSRIASLQEEVNTLDGVQTALENISSNLWGVEEELTFAQKLESKEQEAEADTEEKSINLGANSEELAVEQQKLQENTDKYLEGIDHTGRELMDFLSRYKEVYSLDLEISTAGLGRIGDDLSLSSLRGDVSLDSTSAEEIVTQAREEVAALQVSTEMHRNNLLNDIGNALGSFTDGLEQPVIDTGIEDSIEEISGMLLNNPEAISAVSGIDPPHALSLLI